MRTGPLRRVLCRVPPIGQELLECGHVQSTVSDIYGETNAFRRHCVKCKLKASKDVTIEVLNKALAEHPTPPVPKFKCSKCGKKAYSLDYKVHSSGLCGGCRAYLRLKQRGLTGRTLLQIVSMQGSAACAQPTRSDDVSKKKENV